MPKIVIKDILGLEGEYDLDLEFTNRDFRIIKQTAGVRANEIEDAISAGDIDVYVALAVIALRRAGKEHLVDDLLDAKVGSIRLVDEEEAVPETPPSAEDEPRNGHAPTSSGVGSSGDTVRFPETSTPPGSGIRQPASI